MTEVETRNFYTYWLRLSFTLRGAASEEVLKEYCKRAKEIEEAVYRRHHQHLKTLTKWELEFDATLHREFLTRWWGHPGEKLERFSLRLYIYWTKYAWAIRGCPSDSIREDYEEFADKILEAIKREDLTRLKSFHDEQMSMDRNLFDIFIRPGWEDES